MTVVCLHTTESLCFLKKIIGNDTTSDYFHYLCTQIPVRSRRVDAFLPFQKGDG